MSVLHLARPDYAIVIAYFFSIVLIGYLMRGKAASSKEFFQAGRSLPAWITGIAFVAANCGALEIMGMVSTSAKYGARATNFYWLGAIPAMLFLALYMMPLYRKSGVRSVPEFLQKRFGERTRAFNAFSFAVLTILVSGISLYAMALILRAILGWSFSWSVLVSGGVVLVYVVIGGLTATIYNEVIQFVLIVFGFAPLTFFALRELGGWHGLLARLPADLHHTWKGLPVFDTSAPMDFIGTVMGLGFVLSFGYWCTDFLLIQRALAAKSDQAASETPVIAAIAKLFFPALVVLPGLAAAALFPNQLSSRYDLALPALIARYYGLGLTGLGVTAVLASFMSGMAGNITAFNTVWTYDIYQAYLAPHHSDRHYVTVGRIATILAVLFSVATAYIVLQFNDLMDYVQLLFSFFNAPLFATFLFGMFTKWATPAGGFWGLVSGTFGAFLHYLAYRFGIVHYGSDMAASFYGAIAGWVTCFGVTLLVSLSSKSRNTQDLMTGLVHSRTASVLRPAERARLWWFAAAIILALIVLNLIFY